MFLSFFFLEYTTTNHFIVSFETKNKKKKKRNCTKSIEWMHYSSIRRKLSLLRKESSRVPFKYIYIFIFLGYLKLFINIIWPKTVHHYHYIIPVKSFYWKLNSIEFKGSRLSFENSFERKEEKKLKSIDENKESKKKKEKRKNGRKYISTIIRSDESEAVTIFLPIEMK